jgi:hypothetical protein
MSNHDATSLRVQALMTSAALKIKQRKGISAELTPQQRAMAATAAKIAARKNAR